MAKNNHTEEDYIKAVAQSKSIAEVCRYLGLVPAGGNFQTIKIKINKYSLDTSHFTGQGWNKENYSTNPNSKAAIKRKLLRERGHKCENCFNTEWLGLPITIELEHVDGNNSNNNNSNLLLLCPNCHSQTKTWRRSKSTFIPQNNNPKMICPECGNDKKLKSKRCNDCYQSSKGKKEQTATAIPETGYCIDCDTEIHFKSERCMKCAHINQQKIKWPELSVVIEMLRDASFVQVGKSLGVSDNAVRKFLRGCDVDPKTLLTFVD